MLTTQHTRRVCPTHLFATAAALLTLGFAASSVQAQTWTKTGNPGNLPVNGQIAVSLPANAQLTVGTGALESITGAFSYATAGLERATVNISNPDLFAIRIDGTSPFSATTLGQPSDLYDTQLFLFNSAGYGVYANDDAFEGFRGALISPDISPAPGLYYLGIASEGIVARSGTTAATDIFDNTVDDTTGATPFTGLRTARPGSGPLTRWFLSGLDVETGYYTIALTGASFAASPNAAPVPEASTWVSFGVPTLFVLGVLVRRRVKPAAAAASV